MPYQISTVHHKKRDDLIVGLAGDVRTYSVEGRHFDPTYLPDAISVDANTQEKWLRSGVVLAWDAANSRLVLYDHENGSPTYPFAGVNVHYEDIRNGGLSLNPIVAGTINPDLLWCVNTGGSTDPLTGSDVQTIIEAAQAHDAPRLKFA